MPHDRLPNALAAVCRPEAIVRDNFVVRRNTVTELGRSRRNTVTELGRSRLVWPAPAADADAVQPQRVHDPLHAGVHPDLPQEVTCANGVTGKDER